MNVVTDDQYKTPVLGLNYFHSWAYIIHNQTQTTLTQCTTHADNGQNDRYSDFCYSVA